MPRPVQLTRILAEPSTRLLDEAEFDAEQEHHALVCDRMEALLGEYGELIVNIASFLRLNARFSPTSRRGRAWM